MSGAMHSIESEQSVIGGCLLHNGLIDTVTDMIGHRDFFKIEHQIIWAAIVDLRNAGTACDVVTVSERLEDQHAYDDVGGVLSRDCSHDPWCGERDRVCGDYF